MTAAALPLPGRRPVLADVLPGARTRDVALVGGAALLTALLAQVAIPVAGSPVKAIRLSLGSAKSIEELEIGLGRIAEALQGRSPSPLI